MVRTNWYDIIMAEFSGFLPSLPTIKELLLSIEDDLTRIFCILSYLTGGRTGEIVNYREEQYVRKVRRNRKGVIVKDGDGDSVYEWIKRRKADLVEKKGLMKKNIVRQKIKVKGVGGVVREVDVVSITMRNEKNRKKKFKTIFAPYHFEKELIDNLFEFLDNLDDDEVIVNVNRRGMYNTFIKHAKHLYYPHFIRALRVGVLLEVYEFEPFQVREFMGWSDDRPLDSYYIFKRDKTILKKFINKMDANF